MIEDEDYYKWSEYYDISTDTSFEESFKIYEKIASFEERYVDQQEIASGGMKRIYRAYDKKTDRYIAIARLISNKERHYGSFLAEARLNASLQHPNIIKVHEIGFYEEQPYFTMELKVGDSLSGILEKLSSNDGEYRQKYSLRALLEIYLKVCDAVSYSHSNATLHLDIKPDNIQVGDFGEVLLCDWGIAKYVGDPEIKGDSLLNQDFLADKTLDGEIRGTPGYMAPERIHKKEEADCQTDIYSLGALLYAILTLRNPFDGEIEDILASTVNGRILSPMERCPDQDIPAGLNAVVIKSMQVNKSERYSSVNELKADVSKYLEGFSTSAEDSSPFNELSLFIKRNKKSCAVGLVAVFVLVVSTGVFINSIQKEKNRAQASEKQALENYNKYLQEKEIADISLESDPTSVLAEIKMKFLTNYLQEPVKTVEETLAALKRVEESNDFNPSLYEFMGDVLFICQRFDESYAMLKKGHGRTATKNEPLFDALEAIKDYKSDGGLAPLSVVQKVAQVLDGNFSAQLLRLVIYDRQLRKNFDEHLEIIKLALKDDNPEWDMKGFSYDASTKTVHIKGECRKLTQKFPTPERVVSKLSTIEVEHLRIENCKGIRNRHLVGMKLKSLDLRGMQLDSASLVFTKEVTDKVIATEGMISSKVLRLTKESGVEVVLK